MISCPNGCNLRIVTYEYKTEWKYFVCACSSCSTSWYVCLNCHHQTQAYLFPRQLQRHQKSCDSWTSGFHNCGKHPLSCNLITSKKFSGFKHFGCKKNKEFYYQNQFKNGPAYIVGWSQYHLPNISSYLVADDVLCQTRIADLMLGLSPKQIEQFVNVMRYLEEKVKVNSKKKIWSCDLPTTLNSVRQLYKDGKYAIHNNMPTPDILNIDGHSYVPLNQIMQDALANKCSFESVYSPPFGFKVSHLNQSLCCKKFMKFIHPKKIQSILLLPGGLMISNHTT